MFHVTIICGESLLDKLSYARVPFKGDFLILDGSAYLVNKVILLEGVMSDTDALVSVEPCEEKIIRHREYLN